jgi:hypothetical protein
MEVPNEGVQEKRDDTLNVGDNGSDYMSADDKEEVIA